MVEITISNSQFLQNSQSIGCLILSDRSKQTNLNKSNERLNCSKANKSQNGVNSFSTSNKTKQYPQFIDIPSPRNALQADIRNKNHYSQMNLQSKLKRSEIPKTKSIVSLSTQTVNDGKRNNLSVKFQSKDTDVSQQQQSILFNLKQDITQQKNEDKQQNVNTNQQKTQQGKPQQKKTEQQLIYDKTLYKNDEFFPNHEQISKKIADLVIQKFIKQIIPINNISNQINEQQQQPKQQNMNQKTESDDKQNIQQQKKVTSIIQERQSNVTSLQNIHKIQETRPPSQQSINNRSNSQKQSNQQLKNNSTNNSQQVSYCLSPKNKTTQNIYQQTKSQKNEKVNNQQKHVKTQNDTNTIEDQCGIIDFNKVFDLNEYLSRKSSRESLSPTKRERQNSSGSRGSIKFNEIRNQKKQLKTSRDVSQQEQNYIDDSDRYSDQLKQIEMLQDLINSPKSQSRFRTNTYGNGDTPNVDTIQETHPSSSRSNQIDNLLNHTMKNSFLKYQKSEDLRQQKKPLEPNKEEQNNLQRNHKEFTKLLSSKQFIEDKIKPQSSLQRSSVHTEKNKKDALLSRKTSDTVTSENKSLKSKKQNSSSNIAYSNTQYDQKSLKASQINNYITVFDQYDKLYDQRYNTKEINQKQNPPTIQKAVSQNKSENKNSMSKSNLSKEIVRTESSELNKNKVPAQNKKTTALNNLIHNFQQNSMIKDLSSYNLLNKQHSITILSSFQPK